jgi:methylmalonyl-CoA mutase
VVHYLGDRIRMNAINNPRVYMRSLATRQSNLALSKYVNEAIQVLKAAKYDIIILETSGIGQSIPKLWNILMFRYM